MGSHSLTRHSRNPKTSNITISCHVMWTYHVWGEPKPELMSGFTLVNHCVRSEFSLSLSIYIYTYIGKWVKKKVSTK
jgi:hypothetical protein